MVNGKLQTNMSGSENARTEGSLVTAFGSSRGHGYLGLFVRGFRNS